MKNLRSLKPKITMVALVLFMLTFVVSCSTSSTTTSSSGGSSSSTSSQSSSVSKLDKITMTYVTSPLNVPSIIEKSKSIFENYLKDKEENIKVDYAEITSGADQVQALASGDVDILYAVGATSIISAASNGADIKVLNMYSRAPEAYTLYSIDKIDSAEELRGKTIAGPVGTNLHQLLVAYLEKASMTINDVNFVNMSIPNAKAALDSRSIDAALIAGPTAYIAKQQEYNLITDGVGLTDASVAVAVSEKFLNENKEILTYFKEAQSNIYNYILENKDEVMQIVGSVLDLEKEDVEEMYKQYDFNIEVTASDKEAFQNIADFMYKNEMIENEFNVSSLFLE